MSSSCVRTVCRRVLAGLSATPGLQQVFLLRRALRSSAGATLTNATDCGLKWEKCTFHSSGGWGPSIGWVGPPEASLWLAGGRFLVVSVCGQLCACTCLVSLSVPYPLLIRTPAILD